MVQKNSSTIHYSFICLMKLHVEHKGPGVSVSTKGFPRRAGGGAKHAGLSAAAMARVRAARALVSPQRVRRGAPALSGDDEVFDSGSSASEPDAGSELDGSLSGAKSGGEVDLGACSDGALGLLRLASAGARVQSPGCPGPGDPGEGPLLQPRRAQSEGSPRDASGGSGRALARSGGGAAGSGGGARVAVAEGWRAPAGFECRALPGRLAGAKRTREQTDGVDWWGGAGGCLTPDFGGYVPRGKRSRRGPAAARPGAAAQASAAPPAQAQVCCCACGVC